MVCRFSTSGSSFSLVLGPCVLPPGSEQFDTQTGEVIKLLHVETLLKAIHKTVLWVQSETHSPEDLCVFLAEIVKSVHQLIQIRVCVHHISCQNVIKTMCCTWETLLYLLTPDKLSHLKSSRIRELVNQCKNYTQYILYIFNTSITS